MAKDIGNDNNLSAEEHPSIKIIKENKKEIPKLIFHEIENDFVSKQINKANSKKATGRDGISAKLLKFAKPAIVKPITNLINKSINNSIFPEKLKEAQVVPLFKKNNSLDKCNYRPVIILPTISKFYERAIYEQTVTFFDKVFHPSLSAYRSGYGCQTALLKIIED